MKKKTIQANTKMQGHFWFGKLLVRRSIWDVDIFTASVDLCCVVSLPIPAIDKPYVRVLCRMANMMIIALAIIVTITLQLQLTLPPITIKKLVAAQ